MKNLIMYFYNINIENIRQYNNKYRFEHNNDNYVLENIVVDGNSFSIDTIKKIYDLNVLLINRGFVCNQIITNINNDIVTTFDNKLYILMKVVPNYMDKIALEDIIKMSVKINIDDAFKQNDWKKLWINKIDYFEYQISQFGLKYPLLRESFSYFSGVTENAISMMNYVKNNELYISHKRLNCDSTYYDLYNPFNIILDTRVRDVADYIKDRFIRDEKTDIIGYLEGNNLTENEKQLFFVRMLYPSFYFDIYERIIDGDDELKVKKIIEKVADYELLLFELDDYLKRNKINVGNIEWLKK